MSLMKSCYFKSRELLLKKAENLKKYSVHGMEKEYVHLHEENFKFQLQLTELASISNDKTMTPNDITEESTG